jgi:hypothetical protein
MPCTARTYSAAAVNLLIFVALPADEAVRGVPEDRRRRHGASLSAAADTAGPARPGVSEGPT